MVKMFKKLILFVAVATGLATVSTGALATNKEGDLCWSHKYSTDATFRCSYLFDKKPVSVNEIYKLGYKVVATQIPNANLNANWFIFVEKQ